MNISQFISLLPGFTDVLEEVQSLISTSLWDALILVLCPLNSFSPYVHSLVPVSGGFWVFFLVICLVCFFVTALLSSLLGACEDEQRWLAPGKLVGGCGGMLALLTGPRSWMEC